MSKFKIIGLSLILLGVGMFLFGASMFSYTGTNLDPVISKLGMYSFFLWLPTIITGVLLMCYKKTVIKK